MRRSVAVIGCGLSLLAGKCAAATPQSDSWECVIRDNWAGDDPGFTTPDRFRPNFRLKPDAAVIREVGFRPSPVDQIGVYASPERASWPVVCQRPPPDWKPRWKLVRDRMPENPAHGIP